MGRVEEVQFGTIKLWQTIGTSEKTEARLALNRFQGEIGEGCFEQRFIGGGQECKDVAASHWLQALFSTLLLG